MDRWEVDRAVYSTDSASSELVPTVAEKAAHIFVGFSSNRGTAAPGMLSLAVSFKPAGKQVPSLPCKAGFTLRSLSAGAERSWCSQW